MSHSDEAYAHKLELPAHVSQTMKDRAVRIIETAQNENEVRRLEHEASTGELRRLQYDTMGHERVDAIVRRLSSAPFGMEAIQRPRFQAAAIEVIVDSNVQQIATAKAWLATVRDPKFVKQDHWPLTNATNSIKHLVNSAAYRTPFEGQLRKNHPRMFAALQAQRKEMIELENQIRTEMTLRDIR